MPTINKVIVDGEEIINLDNDTLSSASQIASGITAHLNTGEQVVGTGELALYDYPIGGSLLGRTCTGYHVASGTTSLIGSYQTGPYESPFYNQNNLTNIDLSNIRTIGTNCFVGCTNLWDMKVRSGVEIDFGTNVYAQIGTFNGHNYYIYRYSIYKRDSPSSQLNQIGSLSTTNPFTYTDGNYNITIYYYSYDSRKYYQVYYTVSDEEEDENPVYNKVVVDGVEVINLDNDTVSSTDQVQEGITFHLNNGSRAVGSGQFGELDEYSIGGSLVGNTATGYKSNSDYVHSGIFYNCTNLIDIQLKNGVQIKKDGHLNSGTKIKFISFNNHMYWTEIGNTNVHISDAISGTPTQTQIGTGTFTYIDGSYVITFTQATTDKITVTWTETP